MPWPECLELEQVQSPWVDQLHRFRCRMCIRLGPPGLGFLGFVILLSCMLPHCLCWFIIKCFAVVETRIAMSDMFMKGWIFPTHPNLLEFHFQEVPITNLAFPTGLDTSSRNIALYLASIRPQTNKTVITQNHHYLFMIMLEVVILSQVFTNRLSTSLYHR